MPTPALQERLRARDGEALQFEERSAERIDSIVRTYDEMGDLLVRVDGDRPVDEVTDGLWRCVQRGVGAPAAPRTVQGVPSR